MDQVQRTLVLLSLSFSFSPLSFFSLFRAGCKKGIEQKKIGGREGTRRWIERYFGSQPPFDRCPNTLNRKESFRRVEEHLYLILKRTYVFSSLFCLDFFIVVSFIIEVSKFETVLNIGAKFIFSWFRNGWFSKGSWRERDIGSLLSF